MKNNGYYKSAYINALSLAWYKLLTCKINEGSVTAEDLEVLFTAADKAILARVEIHHSILEDTQYASLAVKQAHQDVLEVAELNDYSLDALIDHIKGHVFERVHIKKTSVRTNEKKGTRRYKMTLAYGRSIEHNGYAVFNEETGRLQDYDLEYVVCPWTSIPTALHMLHRSTLTIALLNTTMEKALGLPSQPA